MNPLKTTLHSLLIVALLFTSLAFKGDKDALHKKVFVTKVTEFRDGKPKAKTEDDEVEFKDGKVFSTLVFDKMGFKWIRYDLKKDSTYVEDEVEKKYFEIEASSTNDVDETIYLTFKIDNFEMEGTMKLTKKDKPKKYYEFVGKEKPSKKDKDKDKKK